jgi:diketogulonate reductase-like aldo/keto reductase
MKNIEEVIYQSIKDGIRLIDTASIYKNEEEVGKGIKKAMDEKIVKREDLFIVTKMWINEKEDPEKALRSSLDRLKLDYVDLYLDHWPSGKSYTGKNEYKLVSIREFWPKMEKLVEQGLTKSIGVSNYNVQNILIVLSICEIKPAINEVEFNPYLYQKELKEFCDKEDIKIFSYYPLVKGRFCTPELVKEKNLDLLNEPVVQELAKKYGKTAGQIVLNWHINVGVVPIPGTSNPNRMKENLGALEFKMEDNEYQSLSDLCVKEFRFCTGLGIYGIDVFA